MIADRAISEKPDDTVNFTAIEELSGEMLFHFVPYAVTKCKEITYALNCSFIQGRIDYHIQWSRGVIAEKVTQMMFYIMHTSMLHVLDCLPTALSLPLLE